MTNPPPVQLAQTDADVARCLPVMKELRPHLTTAEEFVARVRRQHQQAGYRLAFVEDGGLVAAVGGFRVGEYLAWGLAMYIDGLVTAERCRSHGYGGILLEWLIDFARQNGCEQVHLDSGVHRFGAHRFYLLHRMDITSHHFAIKLR
jgi:GNAT superfamily N-acetyltransferase